MCFMAVENFRNEINKWHDEVNDGDDDDDSGPEWWRKKNVKKKIKKQWTDDEDDEDDGWGHVAQPQWIVFTNEQQQQ